MAPVLVEKEKPVAQKAKVVFYRGPPELVAALDRAAQLKNLSRNEAMTQLLRFALAAELAPKPKTKR